MDKIVEFTQYANDASAEDAKFQAVILNNLSKVHRDINNLQVDNVQIKEYLDSIVPPDVTSMYNEART